MRLGTILTIAILSMASVPLHTRGAFNAPSQDHLRRALTVMFPAAPEMTEIARCESGLRHYGADGRVLRGGYGGSMVGLFQLHELYHRDPARSMGYDIDSLIGNMSYARVLYRAQGTAPWRSSAYCWDKSAQVTASTSSAHGRESASITKTLRYGMRDPEVATLKQLLDQLGYRASDKEQDPAYFDINTFKAVSAFQCDQGLACIRDPNKRSGIGVVNRTLFLALKEAARSRVTDAPPPL